MNEFIYILENVSMPGLIKIGRTDRSVSERVSELSSHTGVPTGFTIIKEYPVTNSIEAERVIHERLSKHRVSNNREFFKVDAEDAIDVIESILETVGPKKRRDFAWEDEMVAKALQIVVKAGIARPRMLEEFLRISYEEALFVIRQLQLRGIIDGRNVPLWKMAEINPALPSPILSSNQATDLATEEQKESLRFFGCTWDEGITKEQADDALKECAKLFPDLEVTRPQSSQPKPTATVERPLIGNYQLPSHDFLQLPDLTLNPGESKGELIANARLIQKTLAQFSIDISLGDITKGPTITRYELHPAPGVKLEDIAGLTDDLAAALKTEQINILTPIPGKSAVGIDVPNKVKAKVIIRDLLESDEWRNTKAKIPLMFGKDLYGHPVVADLTEMPHLLAAGTTGSGKSIWIHSIITSLLYRFSPDQLRFVMMDPTSIELSLYNALPHLVVPVVTELKKAILALRWVVNEMEKRYQIFGHVGAISIGTFNSRPNKKPIPQESELQPSPKKEGFVVEVDEEIVFSKEEDIVVPQRLSYVIVVIERLDDFMQVVPSDIETAISRIAQMGRAAGIHLIVTTQLGSQNKLSDRTWTEIPARIAFRCTSRVESRSIIGMKGAETLLGKGDMFYLPPGSAKPVRMQGALVVDQEIQKVVDFIAKQGKPNYDMEIYRQLSRPSASDIFNGHIINEELIQECIGVICSEQKASVSLLQRRLRLGYTHAARIMDELENRGIVGPSKGAEARDILINLGR